MVVKKTGIMERLFMDRGNFLFDNLDNELWKTSLLIDLKIEENATYQIEYIPILKKKNGVIMAEGEKKEEILQDF
ncbi:MAG: hypothetical protein ACLUUO_02205 [Sellimonas intestinalis]